ncbi:MAG TPA: DUF6351 family protein, partial [Micromonosporaceae bacterium]
MRRSAGVLAIAATSTLVLVGSAAPSFAANPHGPNLAITSVSNPHPSLISGGDVLVRITGATGTPTITVDGHATGASVHAQSDGSWLALVSGMSNGRHRIDARSGHDDAQLRVTNHSINGPVFSGPQQLPFICQTEPFGLPPASQPECAAPTQVSYLYKNTSGAFVPLADPTSRP